MYKHVKTGVLDGEDDLDPYHGSGWVFDRSLYLTAKEVPNIVILLPTGHLRRGGGTSGWFTKNVTLVVWSRFSWSTSSSTLL